MAMDEFDTQDLDIPQYDTSNLLGYLQMLWERAKFGKIQVRDDLMKCVNQKKGIYSPALLAKFKGIGSSHYARLTECKCRDISAWLIDMIAQNPKPFDLKPTPVPTIPAKKRMEIILNVVNSIFMSLDEIQRQTGLQVNDQALFAQLDKFMPEIHEAIDDHVKDWAQERMDEISDEIHDTFVESGFYDALIQMIDDMVTFKAGFIKTMDVMERDIDNNYNSDKNKTKLKVKSTIVTKYKTISPFDVYPEPLSSGIEDGYLFHKYTLSRKELYELKGVDGYDNDNIKEALIQYREGYNALRMQDPTEPTREKHENKMFGFQGHNERIDILEFWGSVPGSILKEWGTQFSDKDIEDDREYDILVIMVGDFIIKAEMNPHVLGLKPFFKATFRETSGAFWGESVPELMKNEQDAANAICRAMLNNIAIASGPQVEVNIDRIPEGESIEITPWKVWRATDTQMQSGAKALSFYDAPMHVNELIQAYTFIKSKVDELTIPTYMSGAQQGSMDTASGYSMQLQLASKMLKRVIKGIDDNIIIPAVTWEYYKKAFNKSSDSGVSGYVPDIKILAKGSMSLATREQEVVRRQELLNSTVNPVDMQIIGIEGRTELLKQVIKGLGLDVDKIIPNDVDNILTKNKQIDYHDTSSLSNANNQGNSLVQPALGTNNTNAGNLPVAQNASTSTMMGGSIAPPRNVTPSGEPPAGMDSRLYGNK